MSIGNISRACRDTGRTYSAVEKDACSYCHPVSITFGDCKKNMRTKVLEPEPKGSAAMKNLNQMQGNLVGKDFSVADRAKMLRSVPKAKMLRDRFVAPGVKASQVWNQDVSGSDRRSVKA